MFKAHAALATLHREHENEERSDDHYHCLVALLLVSVVRSSLFAQRAVIVFVANSLHHNRVMVVIVFDITNYESYQSAVTSYFELAKTCSPASGICLVGNKADQGVVRAVQNEEIEEFVEREGVMFFEVCCIGNEGNDVNGNPGEARMGIDMLLNLIMVEVEGLLRVQVNDLYKLTDDDEGGVVGGANDDAQRDGDNENNAMEIHESAKA